jgi:hypothetical protein
MWRLLRKGGLVEEAGPGGGPLRMRGMLCLPGGPLDDRGPAGPGDDTVRATISAPVMAGSTV